MAEPKFGPKAREEYLAAIREDSAGRVEAAARVGVAHKTVRRYVEKHPEFDDDIRQAEAAKHERVEDALYEAAVNGNTTAIIFYLQNRKPDEWQDRRYIRSRLDAAVEITDETEGRAASKAKHRVDTSDSDKAKKVAELLKVVKG